MVALALDGEDLDDHSEEHEVDGSGDEVLRNEEKVSEIDDEIEDSEEGRPAFGDVIVAFRDEVVSAEQQRRCNEDDGDDVEFAGERQGDKASDDQQEERELEQTLDRERRALQLWSGRHEVILAEVGKGRTS